MSSRPVRSGRLWLRRTRSLGRTPGGATGGTLLASFAIQAAVMVSGVLAARMLGVEGRGYLALLILFPYGLAQLVGLGLPLSVTFAVAKDPAAAAALARRLVVIAAVQCASVVALHAGVLALALVGAPEEVRSAGWLTLCVPPALILQYYCLAILQGEGDFLPYNALRSLPFALYAIGIGGLFIAGIETIGTIAAAWSVTYALAAAVSIAISYRRLPRATPEGAVPSNLAMLKFGLKSVVGWASPSENFRLDQAVVGLFLSPAALGLYVVGGAFANLPRLIAQSMGIVAYQRVAAEPRARSGRRLMWRFLLFTVAICALAVVVLEIAAGVVVPLFFGSEFSSAVDVMRILLVAALFAAARRVLTDAARGAGYPGLGTIAEIASWAIMLVAFVAFAPLWGVEGVAFAIVLSAAGSFALLALTVVRSGTNGRGADPAPGLRGAGGEESVVGST